VNVLQSLEQLGVTCLNEASKIIDGEKIRRIEFHLVAVQFDFSCSSD
jgi:hypothetical protein